MTENCKAGKIIYKDLSTFSFVNKTLKRDIDTGIKEWECLKQQQIEIDEIMDDLRELVKSKFESIYEFQIFLIKNIGLK